MENGLEKCPNCNGEGKRAYRGYDNEIIVQNLIDLKKGKSVAELKPSSFLIRMKCFFCNGTGEIGWGSETDNTDKTFAGLEGNLDVYFNSACWDGKDSDHTWNQIDDRKEYLDLERLIDSSQKRYCGIKLDRRFLSMDLDELAAIRRDLDDYFYCNVVEPFTEEKIKEVLKKLGLSDYTPDKFAYSEQKP